MTIHNNLPTILAILSSVNSRFLQNDISGDDSYRPAMLLESIYRTQLGPGDDPDNPRNALGLDLDTEPLISKSLAAALLALKNDPFTDSPNSNLIRIDVVTTKPRRAYQEASV